MIEALRSVRAALDGSKMRFFFALSKACPPGRFGEACDLLEQVFVPNSAALQRATGWRAVACAKLPGADRQLWETIEAMQPWEVLARLDRAILKAK